MFWFNTGTQSGQTIGSYTTIGAELFGTNNGVAGFNPNSAWSGTNSDTRASWMLSNFSGYIWSNSTIFAAGDMRSPIYYDANNTGYYLDPASGSVLNQIQFGTSSNGGRFTGDNSWGAKFFTSDGYIWFGPANGGHAHIYTDRPNFYLNAPITVNGGSIMNTSDIRSNIFYDNNNTGFYLDPASGSNVNWMTVNDWYYINGAVGMYWNSYARGIVSPEQQGNSYGNITTFGSGRNGWSGYGIGSRHVFMSTGGDNVGVHDNSRGWIWYWNGSFTEFGFGHTQFANSARAPIFYDSNDTNYYADFNSTSDNAIRVRGGALHGPNPTWGAFLLVGGDGRQNYINSGVASVCATNGNLHMDAGSGFEMYLNYYDGSVINFGGGSNNVVGRMDASGNIVFAGDVTAFGSPSDIRLKTIKEKIPNALSSILKLNGYRFDWKEQGDILNIKEDIGVIAQEVAEVLPELARTNENGFMSVRHQGLTAVLIEAIKEQQTQIEELKQLVNKLINK